MAKYPQHLGDRDRTAATLEEAARILREQIEGVIRTATGNRINSSMRQELLRHTDHGHFADRNRDGLVEREVVIRRKELNDHGGQHTIARIKIHWDADRGNDRPLDHPLAQTPHFGYAVYTSTEGGSISLDGRRGHVYLPQGFQIPHARHDRNETETAQPSDRNEPSHNHIWYHISETDKWARGR